jgi:predicted secreted protein
MSIATDRFPMEWKVARVTQFFNKGQRTMLDNYRPISILPVVSKLMEKILYDQTYDYLKKQNILSEHQFGFRQFHSTTTTLLDCTNEWSVAYMDRGLYNIVVLSI